MRNRESKIDSFSILSTILLGFDSGIDSKKKSKIGQRTGIGIEKESDSTQLYFNPLRCDDTHKAPWKIGFCKVNGLILIDDKL